MSRSYKHTPIVKSTGKHEKKIANKLVRKSKYLSNGCCYKKVYNRGWIHDYSCYINKNSEYHKKIVRK